MGGASSLSKGGVSSSMGGGCQLVPGGGSQYFTVPHLFLQESTEITGIPQE